jgi:hypothetical protein
MSTDAAGAKLRELFAIFGDEYALDLRQFEVVPADAVPQPYRDLLVHEHHMTVTVEKFHGCRVELRVLAQRRSGNYYARMILLAREGTGEIVQFGIMRVDLDYCSEPVQTEILDGMTPLGRILIEHNVLRQIDPSAYLRITPNRHFMNWFHLSTALETYGRLAWIFCNGLPAVELLEVVRPEAALEP